MDRTCRRIFRKIPGAATMSTSSRAIMAMSRTSSVWAVTAIIGLIAAISFPSASAGIESVRLVSATDSVATFLNGAVNRVERRQQPIELIVSPRENRIWLYSNEPGFTRELKMADGIVIEGVLPPVEEDADGA